jgi:hypothetical protein
MTDRHPDLPTSSSVGRRRFGVSFKMCLSDRDFDRVILDWGDLAHVALATDMSIDQFTGRGTLR